ncbi:MAG TPA: alkaline phosphatase [Bryobacteraceae bacterium]|nr:alkaline phosphatase [Bryobacteraceae bacterium]
MRTVAKVVVFLWGLSAWAQPPDDWRARRVIVIGVDGLSVDGVNKAHIPRLKRLMERAAWTLEARAVLPTLSSPNWESIITGAGTEQHGITSNGYLRKLVEFQPACLDAQGMFPTIFGLLRAARPSARIAVFHDWGGFANLLEKNAPDVLKHESGPEKTTAAAIQYWKGNLPALLFIHLDNVDHTGHEEGWSSPAYLRAVEDADKHIGEILDMVNEASAEDSTFIMITSDHGGKGRNHGGNSMEEMLVPWVFSGPDVAPGQINGPVYAYDTAATLAWIYGFSLADCAIGRPVLAAFRPAAVALRIAGQPGTGERGCQPLQPRVPAGSPVLVAPYEVGIGHSKD